VERFPCRQKVRKILFINSHFYSGGIELYSSLSENSYIQGCRTYKQRVYSNNHDLFQLLNHHHKRNDNKAIYLDEIYFNYALSPKMDLSKCYFIHLIRSPECLNYFKEKINPTFILRKYLYRLRRICEVAKKTPNAIFLTYNDLKKQESMDLIKDFLSLEDTPILNIKENNFQKDLFSYNLMKEAEDGYERYFAFMKQQNILKL
jgi:hypothetical protein